MKNTVISKKVIDEIKNQNLVDVVWKTKYEFTLIRLQKEIIDAVIHGENELRSMIYGDQLFVDSIFKAFADAGYELLTSSAWDIDSQVITILLD
jgi:hypothetical protein